MKTRSCVTGCILGVLVLLAGAGIAQADLLYSCNFEAYTAGSLNGQDGWSTSFGALSVAAGPGVNTTKTATGSLIDCGALRSFAAPLSFSAGTQMTQLLSTYASGTGAYQCATGGAVATGTSYALDLFGQGGSGTAQRTYIRSDAGLEYWGDTLTVGHWYEIKLTTDFSTVGGLTALSYRDLTNAETAFTADATLHDVNMGFTPNGDGKYTFDRLTARMGCLPGASYIDNYSMATAVPEPGTVTVLATGLIGLLAYAWRKRK